MLIRFREYSPVDTRNVVESKSTKYVAGKTPIFVPETRDSDFVAIPIARDVNTTTMIAVQSDQFIYFNDLNYGEDVNYWGYPLYTALQTGTGGFDFPIVRHGVISFFAISDVHGPNGRVMMPGMLLVDGVSIGGNSGGPAFIRRPYINKDFLISYDKRFMGIIAGHLTVNKLQKIGLNNQTIVGRLLEYTDSSEDSIFVGKLLGEMMLSDEENSGLAYVISIDIIEEYILRRNKEGQER